VSSPSILQRAGTFRKVVIVTGHMTDAPDRATPRFPESEVSRVRSEVYAAFRLWDLGANDLLICGAARGGDLISATAARSLGATVWALLAHPSEKFVTESVAGGDPAWIEEYRDLLQHAPSWDLTDTATFADRSDVYAAANEWMLATANHQADDTAPNLLAIWDGTDAGGIGGTAHMVAEAQRHNTIVKVISPLARGH
jgi:hypothetical protein